MLLIFLVDFLDDLALDQETLELDSMAITPGEAQLIQETLVFYSKYLYQSELSYRI